MIYLGFYFLFFLYKIKKKSNKNKRIKMKEFEVCKGSYNECLG